MKTRWFILSSVALVAILLLLAGQRPAAGQDQGGQGLAGTWNVTLKFPQCTLQCPCPGGVPNIPIPAMHGYSPNGSLLELPGGTLFRGPGLGLWHPGDDDQFVAHFKFFLFKFDGSGGPRGSEEVTSYISLTSPDTFDASATFDLFDTAGNLISQGCAINETGTRFK